MKEALFWDAGEGKDVKCRLCHQHCIIKPGKRGLCRVRENRDGKLVTLVYGRVIAASDDPIEKKPLYHVLPGSRSYSIATCGCNFRCLHCQNCTIAQPAVDDDFSGEEQVEPERVVRSARALNCRSVAYTYTEPTVFFEYAYDVARLAKEAGLKNVFVTNGYITPEALEMLAPFLDAANIDLKFMSDRIYRDTCGAHLQPVLDMIRHYHRLGIWIEVTTLVIPGLSDSEKDLRGIAGFVADVDPAIPWHVSGFYPTYRMLDRAPTPPETLRKARAIGREEGLHYVYTGNIADEEGSQTCCPDCGELVIGRDAGGRRVRTPGEGKCPACGRRIEGVWD